MTLDEAIREAFGRTHYVRRERWPDGAAGAINYLPGAGLDLIWFTMGKVHAVTPTDKDLQADDWYACTSDTKPVVEDWRDALAIRHGNEIHSIDRGAKCTVLLDNRRLPGECTLAWAVPDRITLAVSGDSGSAWPDDGMFLPVGHLVLSSGGVDLPFILLESACWHPQEKARLYHFVVVRSDRGEPTHP